MKLKESFGSDSRLAVYRRALLWLTIVSYRCYADISSFEEKFCGRDVSRPALIFAVILSDDKPIPPALTLGLTGGPIDPPR